MKRVKISIVTVSLNCADTISRTIESVLFQDYDNIEYIIIDGLSTDGTLEVINNYQHSVDSFISEPDLGIYDAMNKAISIASGELIGFINGDDWYEKGVIKRVVDEYILGNEDIIYGDTFIASNTEANSVFLQVASDDIDSIKYDMPFNHQSVFVKTELLKRCGFDLRYRIRADYHFFYKLYFSGYTFRHIKSPFSYYSLGGYSSMDPARFSLETFCITNDIEIDKVYMVDLANYEYSEIVYNQMRNSFLTYIQNQSVDETTSTEVNKSALINVVWGAGIWGRRCMELLDYLGKKYILVDSDEYKCGEIIRNHVVKNPNIVRQIQGCKVIISSPKYEEEIRGILIRNYKFSEEDISTYLTIEKPYIKEYIDMCWKNICNRDL